MSNVLEKIILVFGVAIVIIFCQNLMAETTLKNHNYPPTTSHVEASHGAMRLGLILQTGYGFYPDLTAEKRSSFFVNNARIFIEGFLLSKELTYEVSGDSFSGTSLAKNANLNSSDMGSLTSVPLLLDAKITWNIKKIGVKFSIGRFIPKWGLMMPSRMTKLGAISYPLYVQGGINAMGSFRNVGMDAQIDIASWLCFEGGIFNGGVNTWNDDNDAKDFIGGLLFKPAAGLKIRMTSQFSFSTVTKYTNNELITVETFTETHIKPIFETRYQNYGFDIILGGALDIVIRNERDYRDDQMAMGIVAHIGYFIMGDWFELMARLDLWDPGIVTVDSYQTRITAGPQFFLDKIHSQIRINYIFDRYGSNFAMCQNHLKESVCLPSEILSAKSESFTSEMIPAQAKKFANTFLIVFNLDI